MILHSENSTESLQDKCNDLSEYVGMMDPDTSTRDVPPHPLPPWIFSLCSFHCFKHKTRYSSTVNRMPPPANVFVTLTFDPMTLKTFSAVPTHMTNICRKFHSNPSTKYRDIVSRGIGLKEQRTDGRTTRQHNALRLLLYYIHLYSW